MQMDDLGQRGLVLCGCGKMGSAMLAGWLSGGLRPVRSGWQSRIPRTGSGLRACG